MSAASALLAELPETAGELGLDGIKERDRLILDMLYAGQAPLYEWVQLVSAGPAGVLRMLVGADAVKIGDETDSVRVNLCQLAAQELADRHDAALLTPKLVDLRWEQAGAKLLPTTIDPYPADQTWAMVRHSREIDSKLPPGWPPNMVIGNVGKGAVNSTLLWNPPKPDRMAIYGWHWAGGAYPAVLPDEGRVIQPESIRHLAYFVDYSATVVLLRREVEFTNDQGSSVRDIADVATDPELHHLVSASGPVIMRHPGVACGATEMGNPEGGLPVACPVPSAGAPPTSAAPISNWALAAGGVALAGTVAYFATR